MNSRKALGRSQLKAVIGPFVSRENQSLSGADSDTGFRVPAVHLTSAFVAGETNRFKHSEVVAYRLPNSLPTVTSRKRGRATLDSTSSFSPLVA